MFKFKSMFGQFKALATATSLVAVLAPVMPGCQQDFGGHGQQVPNKKKAAAQPLPSEQPLSPDQLAALVQESDAFFARAGGVKIATPASAEGVATADKKAAPVPAKATPAPDKKVVPAIAKDGAPAPVSDTPSVLIEEWEQEGVRDTRILATIPEEPASVSRVKFLRRRGVAWIMTSKGKGSKDADSVYSEAEKVLAEVRTAKGVTDDQYGTMMATILKERGDNATLQGETEFALSLLLRALKFAQSCSLAGQLGEATIEERITGIFFRAEEWQKALNHAPSAVAIMLPLSVQPDFDQGALRAAIWAAAISKSRLAQNAEAEFSLFLTVVGKDITPHDEADVYREVALNIGEVSERVWKESSAIPENLVAANLTLKAARIKAHSYITRAREIIDQSKLVQDNEEKFAIYIDLAMSYWRGDLIPEADKTFKEAIVVALQAPQFGKNSPGLIPVRQRYAAMLKALGRDAAAGAQLAEVERIVRFHRKWNSDDTILAGIAIVTLLILLGVLVSMVWRIRVVRRQFWSTRTVNNLVAQWLGDPKLEMVEFRYSKRVERMDPDAAIYGARRVIAGEWVDGLGVFPGMEEQAQQFLRDFADIGEMPHSVGIGTVFVYTLTRPQLEARYGGDDA